VESVLLFAQILILLALSGLAIYLIVVLKHLREVLITVDANLKEVGSRVVPVLENLEVITSRVRTIVENFDDQLVVLQNSVKTIKGVADNIAAFEQRIQDTIEGPVVDVMNTIGGIIRGFSAFFNRFRIF
jgi:uncharacterized protein YoxC